MGDSDKLDERSAIEIAKKFVGKEYSSAKFPLNIGSGSAALCRNKYGRKHLDVGEEYWSIYFCFIIKDDSIATMDPSHVAVAVDAFNGDTIWIPLL